MGELPAPHPRTRFAPRPASTRRALDQDPQGGVAHMCERAASGSLITLAASLLNGALGIAIANRLMMDQCLIAALRLIDDLDHHARRASRVLTLDFVVDLLERFDRVDARHLIRGLIAHFAEHVEVPRALGGAQHLKLLQIQGFDVRLTERDVERMVAQTGVFCCIGSIEAEPHHGVDCLSDLTRDA